MADPVGAELRKTFVTPAERVSLERAAPDALSPVDVAARYAPVSALGEGGMGEVWLARDVVIGRDVAVKTVLRARAGDATTRARFLREARVQGQLAHPSIVPVHDVGMGADGRPYFTMQRVRGRALDEIARSGELSRHAALTAMSRICLAVDYAHAHGVVHRDIKPSNLMVGDYGEVYVLDWGLAKLVDADDLVSPSASGPVEDDDDKETTVGAVLGTPGYMAPEQIRCTPVDERTDVYALGACLFELLAGVPLHEGTSMKSLMQSTLQGANARISDRAPGRDIAPELEAICTRATQLDPDYRFASARAMQEAIERYLEGDRDLEQRRRRSEEHARAAARLAEAALGASDHEARADAMREVGRALALDPHNGEAMKSLVRLLTEPPRTPPPEVDVELRGDLERRAASAARYSAVALLSVLPAIVPVWLMGIRDWRWVAATMTFTTLAAASAIVPRRLGMSSGIPLVVAFSIAGLVCESRVAGPLLLVPTLALGLGVGLAVFPRTVSLGGAIAAGCAGVLLPLALEWAGVLARSYDFGLDRLCVRAQAVGFAEGPALAYFLAVSLIPIVVVCVYLVRIRDRLVDAERRLRVQAWQLGNIVPRVP